MSAPPLIHVVDDDEGFRVALLRLLEAAGYAARGYGSAGEFLLHPHGDRPGCLLLDLDLPGPSGLELQDALESHGAALPVVFLTGHGDVTSAVRALKAGAVDFLTKPVERAALFDAVHRALERDGQQRAARGEADELRSRFATLTSRERAVLERVGAGEHNKEIARELGIAERTVKLYRAHGMEKLGIGSAAELGRLAEQLRRQSEP
jgi:FixJ family two-component response regulator